MLASLRLFLVLAVLGCGTAFGQAYGPPDRGEPGDAMIQAYLERLANRLSDSFENDVKSLAGWQENRDRYRAEYLYTLGLDPLPERTPLDATITGTLEGEGYVVDMLHYQSRPGLYVTANLYRPSETAGRKLPAVLYVCGHSGRGRNGNKTAFQPHGIWFARHGYVCLIVDTLQLGEIAATHHGTYREQRWWWQSRGYTPAGVECWNGVRGIDYLVSRPDVDAERIAVTGISGGGAATFWVAAADDRVRVAVPVSGMADLPSYVGNRVINGHCDCMFLYNTFQWPWTRIAGLVAPRPLLFINSDNDVIFPMDANERIIARLERLYSLYGEGDLVDAVVSVGGHAYRKDIRRAAFRFINIHLKGDAGAITDSEVDLSDETARMPSHPIEPEKLRAFPTDADIPAGQLNTTIDEHFVPVAKVEVPAPAGYESWKSRTTAELRRVSFRNLPERVPAARVVKEESLGVTRVETEGGIVLRLERPAAGKEGEKPGRVVLVVQDAAESDAGLEWLSAMGEAASGAVYRCQPRGTGDTRWTRKNPPNYVERSHALLGTTVDAGRVYDVIAIARLLKDRHKGAEIVLAGRGAAGVLAAYAALFEPDAAAVLLDDPPTGHMDAAAPVFLNVLRVADIPDALGLLAPRKVVVRSADKRFEKTAAFYAAAGAVERFEIAPGGAGAKSR